MGRPLLETKPTSLNPTNRRRRWLVVYGGYAASDSSPPAKMIVARPAKMIVAPQAMNILRLIGQRGLLGPDAPVRHNAKRRRIKTVMQELIYRAGRLIETGRRVILGLGANDRAAQAFIRLHAQFAPMA